MRRVKSKDTSIEILLRKELWKRGFRYRKNVKDIFGKPDIVFEGKKVAIFADSEFWHGKYLMEGKYIPKTNTEFWIEKIERNTEREGVLKISCQFDKIQLQRIDNERRDRV